MELLALCKRNRPLTRALLVVLAGCSMQSESPTAIVDPPPISFRIVVPTLGESTVFLSKPTYGNRSAIDCNDPPPIIEMTRGGRPFSVDAGAMAGNPCLGNPTQPSWAYWSATGGGSGITSPIALGSFVWSVRADAPPYDWGL